MTSGKITSCIVAVATKLMTIVTPWTFAATWLLLAAPLVRGNDLTDKPGEAPPEAALAQPAPTSELLVFLYPGTDVAQFAQARGLLVKYRLQSDPDAYVFIAASVESAVNAHLDARTDASIRASYLNERTKDVKLGFVPNDPYFHKDTPSAGWLGQWHLINEHVAGRDARVQGAWNRDLVGIGVVIGIVDDCLETAHPDLSPNYIAADSYDFGQNDSNPDPVYTDDDHGISVAGVAGARGGNGIGVSGAAPHAGLAGLRIDWPNQTDAMFVDATQYHSSGANTDIKIKNHSYGATSPYSPRVAQESALATSSAAGTIHVWAAGNERGQAMQDANKKARQNSPYAITVAAMGSDGKYASYSSFGANVFVTAPSNSATGFTGITTTDRTTEANGYNGSGDSFPDSDYTSQFGGTSSATPLVAGVMALGKQAQPNLNLRLAKHMLVRTSDVVDASDATEQSDGGWKTNAAGNKFNQNYGFGLIDADGLTQLATQYSGVTPLTTASTGTVSVSAAIPDNNPTGISRSFTVSPANPLPLEEVLVTLNITHAYRGDLEAFVTSPGGTTSRLMIRSSSDSGVNINWTFITNAFWGESPGGTWTLKVRDMFAADTGTWSSYSVTLRMGELITAPAPTISGQVTLDGVGLAGVTMTGLPGDPTTGPSGNYEASVDYDWSGTVTPSKDGYTFSPSNRTCSNVIIDQENQDYTASTVTCTISGQVTLDGVGLAGVTMAGLPGDPTTGSSGNYEASVDYDWSGTVTPSKDGYTFSPSNRTYSNVIIDQENQDYTASTVTCTISGQVTLDGVGLAGVTMAGLPGDPTTDPSGTYSGTVSYDWSGTVTPMKPGYTFSPSNRTCSNVIIDQENQDYTASTVSCTISGQVTLDGVGLAGVTMAGLPGDPTTGPSGTYSGTVSYDWSGTVTPSLSGHIFEPQSRSYASVSSDVGGEDYTAIPGDVDGDGDVDIFDVIDTIAAFGAVPGDPNWNPGADFDFDGQITISDVIDVISHFGAGT